MSEFFPELNTEEVSTQSRAARDSARKRKRVRTGIVLFIVTVLVVAAAVVAFPYVRGMFKTPTVPDYEGAGISQTELVTIPDGATGTSMAQILHGADVVASERAFVDAFNADPRSASIQPGTYRLNLQMAGSNAVTALLDPASRAEVSITIPEGFTAAQIYDRIANVFSVPLEDVQAAAADTESLGLPPEANGAIEGWLAPVTYSFAPDATPADILSTMIAHRLTELESLNVPRENWERLLNVASIVEREVNWPEYYGQVARVIENRLQGDAETNGRLQMDSTVNYGQNKVGGVPTMEDLRADTPYNTYIHAGLPPTPVSNPGVAVIRESINPPEGDWLYFVTVNLDTGETLFANTLSDHNANVEQYRQWVADNRGN